MLSILPCGREFRACRPWNGRKIRAFFTIFRAERQAFLSTGAWGLRTEDRACSHEHSELARLPDCQACDPQEIRHALSVAANSLSRSFCSPASLATQRRVKGEICKGFTKGLPRRKGGSHCLRSEFIDPSDIGRGGLREPPGCDAGRSTYNLVRPATWMRAASKLTRCS